MPVKITDADVRTGALVGLLVLAVFYTFYFAREFVLPIVTAGVFSLLLSPSVRWLSRRRVPETAAAGGVILLFTALIAVLGYWLIEPAVVWMQEAPAKFALIEEKLKFLRAPMDEVAKATEHVERMTRASGDSAGATPVVEVKDNGMRDMVINQTPTAMFNALLTVILLFFMLANRDLFLRDIVRMLPRLSDKRRAVEISREIECKISAYLSTVTVINIALGLAVGVAMALVGMPNPVVWGALAGLLNYIPYIGPTVTAIVIGMVSLLTFDTVGEALIAPAIYLVLNTCEAYILTPFLLGKRLSLNPVVLFISLLFWFWIWGVAGGLLAVPLLAITKIICDGIVPLQFVGQFLGAEEGPSK